MKYRLEFRKKAMKFLEKHKQEKTRFLKAFKDISEEKFKEYDIKKIKGQKDFYRLRIGKYRAIYTIINDQLVILVLDIDSRGDIYK
jgi:mRNA interferase RelE/StbE